MKKEEIPDYIEIKNEINKEGYEANKDGGAAVIIGSKEEAEKIKQQIESGGQAENLGSYISLHKKIIVPENETNEEIKNNSGKCWTNPNSEMQLLFIDKQGNIVEVEVEPGKINSFKSCLINEEADTYSSSFINKGIKIDANKYRELLKNELNDNYFDMIHNLSSLALQASGLIGKYIKEEQERNDIARKKAFDQ